MNRILFYLLLQLLSLLIAGNMSASQNTSDPPVLRFGVFISSNSLGLNSFDYAGFRPALEIGFQTVMNSSMIRETELGKYQINYTVEDAKCDAATTLRSFIDLINPQDPPMIMILGSDCSVSTEPIASISHNWNLVQISQSSSSPHLSNTHEFPRFLRTVSSDAAAATGVSSVMKHFGWSRVALLTQSETIFTSFSTEFKSHISSCGLNLIGEYTFTSRTSATLALVSLQNSPARIVFLNMYEEFAAEILCMAYRKGMRYPDYVWMVHHWYNMDWWRQGHGDCNHSEMMIMLRMQFVIDHYPRIDDEDKNITNVGGITWYKYEELYDQGFHDTFSQNSSVSYNLDDAAFMFDTVWAAVLALNSTVAKGYSLTEFDYTNDIGNISLSTIIFNEAKNVNFFGLTGNVSFSNTTGDRPGRIRFFQYRGGNESHFPRIQFGYKTDDKFMYTDGSSSDTVFPDGVPVDEEYVRISLPLFVTYTALSAIGIIFACVCLWFNLWFRNHKIVKLSSPHVNVMIIAGAIVFYVTVILFGVDENITSFSVVDGLCHARIWLCVIGLSLLYGTIFAKALRIYYIFNHLKPNSKVEVKDIYLFGIVVLLVTLDVIFMLPTTVISSAVLRREEEEISGDKEGDLPQIIGICDSDDAMLWLIVLFLYKGITLLLGVFLAFEIRKVKIVSLNESRFIGMSVYGTVIVSAALTPIGFQLQDSPTLQYSILGLLLLSSITIVLSLVFVTKMYKVYHDPEGKNVNLGVSTGDQQQRSTFQCNEETYKLQIQKLNGEVAMLRKRLKDNKLDYEIDNNHTDDGMNHESELSTEV